MTSVVSTMAPIEAAFSTADRVTLAGSTMPRVKHVRVLVGQHVVAERGAALLLLPPADVLEHDRAVHAGVLGQLAHRLLERLAHDAHADLRVAPSSFSLSSADWALISATPPPGTMPSSTAERVADRASSTRCFFSLSSVSVPAPTLMIATPPDSLAMRSWSFSLS